MTLTKIVNVAKFRQGVRIVSVLYAPVPYFDNLWEGEGGEGGGVIIPRTRVDGARGEGP